MFIDVKAKLDFKLYCTVILGIKNKINDRFLTYNFTIHKVIFYYLLTVFYYY